VGDAAMDDMKAKLIARGDFPDLAVADIKVA
jgi:hypothetical protein